VLQVRKLIVSCGTAIAQLMGATIVEKEPLVLQSGFWWPTLFNDCQDFVQRCDKCQRTGNISKRNEMPLTGIIKIEPFYYWGIDFMGPFPSSYSFLRILVCVDYDKRLSTWKEY